MVEFDRSFICQFVAVRRAFLVPSRGEPKFNYLDPITLTTILKDNKCNLRDLANVYNIFHMKEIEESELNRISKMNILACDRVVNCLGLDKRRSEYYHNSRLLLKDKSKLVESLDDTTDEFNHELPEKIVAIKSIRITTDSKQ